LQKKIFFAFRPKLFRLEVPKNSQTQFKVFPHSNDQQPTFICDIKSEMNSNGTMFGMCNPETAGVYPHHVSHHHHHAAPSHHHHHHHQSQLYGSSDLVGGGSPPTATSLSPFCGAGNGNGDAAEASHHHGYGLQQQQHQAHLQDQARETKYDPNNGSTTSHSPTGIISDNGLQYANLDGSAGPGYHPGAGNGPYHSHLAAAAAAASQLGQAAGVQSPYSHYSDIHSDGLAGLTQGGPGGPGSFSAYLDNTAMSPYASQYPGLYGHHAAIKSMRGGHDFSPPSYPHEFSSKPAPSVPTYKWMQVKRNVPKPGKKLKHYHIKLKSKLESH